MNKEKLGKCCKIAMIEKDINIPGMAEKLEVAESTINNYRAGKVDNIMKLSKFAEACDMTFNELMALSE